MLRIGQDTVAKIIQIRKQNCTRSYLGVGLIRVECHKAKKSKRKKIDWHEVEMRPPVAAN